MTARAAVLAAGLFAAALGLGAAPPHKFDLTYRGFGPVAATSDFRVAEGYEVRFEGCYAKHSAEAICGFTLRASRPLTVTNRANLSHAAAADGTPIRTCCIFVQGDPQGYPITTQSAPLGAPAGDVGALQRRLAPGETAGFMLRIPNYKAAPPVATITFSHGEADPGLSFPARISELP